MESYIWIVILILFAVSRALGESQRKKRQFEERQRRQVSEQEVPHFDREEIYELPVDDTTKKVLEDSRPLQKVQEIKRELERDFQDYSKYKEQGQKRNKLKEVKHHFVPEKDTVRPDEKKRSTSQSPLYGLQFTDDEIVRGIIMSEILQPPKAKRKTIGYR